MALKVVSERDTRLEEMRTTVYVYPRTDHDGDCLQSAPRGKVAAVSMMGWEAEHMRRSTCAVMR